MRLAEVGSRERDNNFKLIRVAAALAVLVTHSFVLATGDRDAEPLNDSLGLTLGDIAVDVFFVTSGFLVTASLLRRERTLDYLRARALRVYPALWAMLLVVVFALGPSCPRSRCRTTSPRPAPGSTC
jgi:peptidoglycan/LPS O-acetylase OafA/YrhL